MLVSSVMQMKWLLISIAAGALVCAACSTPAVRTDAVQPSLPAAFEQAAPGGGDAGMAGALVLPFT